MRTSINISINGRILEAKAQAALWPGMLLNRVFDADSILVIPHDQAISCAAPIIAVENRYAGNMLDVLYEQNETVYYRYCLPGDMFVGLVSTVPGLSVGSFVVSAGDGLLTSNWAPPVSDGVIVGRLFKYLDLHDFIEDASFAEIEVF